MPNGADADGSARAGGQQAALRHVAAAARDQRAVRDDVQLGGDAARQVAVRLLEDLQGKGAGGGGRFSIQWSFCSNLIC